MSAEIKTPITTERLVITEFENSDYYALEQIAFNINQKADKEKSKGYMPFYTFQVDADTPDRDLEVRQKVAQFIIKSHKEKNTEPRSTYRMAVRKKDDNTLVGNVTIDMLPFEENGKFVYGDLGYFINPEHEKKGYATEAVRAISHEFFKKYEQLDITAHPDNLNSQKLIERIGGKKIGYKDSSNYGHGEPRAIFTVMKKDFYRTAPYAQKLGGLLLVLASQKKEK
ncbi:MAG: GNAT family N-acetyltransferase [Alphaproteobacteria bacterium]